MPAAFAAAEEIYQSRTKWWAAVVAVVLSLGYHWATTLAEDRADLGGWGFALVVGLVAVPLAPVAKDEGEAA